MHRAGGFPGFCEALAAGALLYRLGFVALGW